MTTVYFASFQGGAIFLKINTTPFESWLLMILAFIAAENIVREYIKWEKKNEMEKSK
jgi:hypothetical protein